MQFLGLLTVFILVVNFQPAWLSPNSSTTPIIEEETEGSGLEEQASTSAQEEVNTLAHADSQGANETKPPKSDDKRTTTLAPAVDNSDASTVEPKLKEQTGKVEYIASSTITVDVVHSSGTSSMAIALPAMILCARIL